MPESLRDLQTRFAAHLRHPATHPAPDDVEDRRMAIYRRLFFRNISNFLAKNFPVLRFTGIRPDGSPSSTTGRCRPFR